MTNTELLNIITNCETMSHTDRVYYMVPVMTELEAISTRYPEEIGMTVRVIDDMNHTERFILVSDTAVRKFKIDQLLNE